VIVHDIIVQENLLTAPSTHVQSRKIVERAGRTDASKEPRIGAIPKWMVIRPRHSWLGRFLFCVRSIGRFLRANSWSAAKRNINSDRANNKAANEQRGRWFSQAQMSQTRASIFSITGEGWRLHLPIQTRNSLAALSYRAIARRACEAYPALSVQPEKNHEN